MRKQKNEKETQRKPEKSVDKIKKGAMNKAREKNSRTKFHYNGIYLRKISFNNFGD